MNTQTQREGAPSEANIRDVIENLDRDDFKKGISEAERYLSEMSFHNREGIDDARAFLALKSLIKKLDDTEFGRATQKFAETEEPPTLH